MGPLNLSSLLASTKTDFLHSRQGKASPRKENDVRSQGFPKGGLKASLIP